MSYKTWGAGGLILGAAALDVVGVATFIGNLVLTGGLEDGRRSDLRTTGRGVREKPVMITTARSRQPAPP